MSFSATARLVALGLHYEAQAGRAAGVPQATRQLAAIASPRWLRSALAEYLMRRLETAWLPGLAAHYVARKAWFWDVARGLIDQGGIERVVMLGPGCDGLALALRQLKPDLRIYEIVHPREREARLELLACISGSAGVEVLGLELNRPQAPAVLRTLVRDSRPTLWIAEAVLMYLSPRAVLRLARALSPAAGTACALFSLMVPDRNRCAAFHQANAAVGKVLAIMREPFRWALSPLRLRRVLGRHGFRIQTSVNETATPGFCAGEALYLALRD